MSKKIVAVVGGTGHLGTLIVNALVAKPEVHVRLLVRTGSRAKVAHRERHGAEIVEGGLRPENEWRGQARRAVERPLSGDQADHGARIRSERGALI